MNVLGNEWSEADHEFFDENKEAWCDVCEFWVSTKEAPPQKCPFTLEHLMESQKCKPKRK